MVTHVHGAVGVGDESDGYAEAWYLPAANNIPAGYATQGHLVRLLQGARPRASYGAAWGPGFAVVPVSRTTNRASTIWYHDHALGHDAAERLRRPGRLLHRPRRPGRRRRRARLAHRQARRAARSGARGRTTSSRPTRPTTRSRSPSRTARSTPTGRCSTRTRARSSTAITGPYIPDTDLSPIWNPEFFGNTIMVNGNTWPFQTVEQRRYRFRFLNGCQSRFLILDFTQDPRRRGLADRQRGRLPGGAGQPHGDQRQPAADGPGRARRRDRRLHQRAGRQLRARQRRSGRAVRRRRAGQRLRRGRSGHDRPDHAVPGRAERWLPIRRRRRSSWSCRRSRRCRRRSGRGRWRCSR